MNVARDLLDDLALIGATVQPAGDRLILRAGPTAIPAALVHRVREAKADLIATLARHEASSRSLRRVTAPIQMPDVGSLRHRVAEPASRSLPAGTLRMVRQARNA